MRRLAGMILVAGTLHAGAAGVQDLLEAMRFVESSNLPVGAIPRGDGGRSRGPLQISRAYWIDSEVPGQWADHEGWHYSVRVVLAYWRRYAPGR